MDRCANVAANSRVDLHLFFFRNSLQTYFDLCKNVSHVQSNYMGSVNEQDLSVKILDIDEHT